MRRFVSPFLHSVLLALAAACGGTSSSRAAGSADGSAPCVKDSDCGASQVCAFRVGDGCNAQGHCFASPPPGVHCNAYEPACACDGTVVGVACTNYPDGYAGKPIAYLGQCSDAGSMCGTMTCSPADVCVATATSGGACGAPDDAGACPPGELKQGSCCVTSSTSYACQALPAACAGTPSCACASTLCSCSCRGATGNELDCVCLAP